MVYPALRLHKYQRPSGILQILPITFMGSSESPFNVGGWGKIYFRRDYGCSEREYIKCHNGFNSSCNDIVSQIHHPVVAHKTCHLLLNMSSTTSTAETMLDSVPRRRWHLYLERLVNFGWILSITPASISLLASGSGSTLSTTSSAHPRMFFCVIHLLLPLANFLRRMGSCISK